MASTLQPRRLRVQLNTAVLAVISLLLLLVGLTSSSFYVVALGIVCLGTAGHGFQRLLSGLERMT